MIAEPIKDTTFKRNSKHAPLHRGTHLIDFVDGGLVLLLHFPPHGARASAGPSFGVQIVPHVLQVPFAKRKRDAER